MRYGYHLVTDCPKANQGKKSRKDVEATIIHHLNTYTNIMATKATTFPERQASRHPPLRHHHHRQSGGPHLAPRRHVYQSSGQNQELINRAALRHQPGPQEHDPRNDVLSSAKRAEERKHTKYDAICAATGSVLSPFALETTGGHGAYTLASVYHSLGTCS